MPTHKNTKMGSASRNAPYAKTQESTRLWWGARFRETYGNPETQIKAILASTKGQPPHHRATNIIRYLNLYEGTNKKAQKIINRSVNEILTCEEKLIAVELSRLITRIDTVQMAHKSLENHDKSQEKDLPASKLQIMEENRLKLQQFYYEPMYFYCRMNQAMSPIPAPPLQAHTGPSALATGLSGAAALGAAVVSSVASSPMLLVATGLTMTSVGAYWLYQRCNKGENETSDSQSPDEPVSEATNSVASGGHRRNPQSRPSTRPKFSSSDGNQNTAHNPDMKNTNKNK